ncbi:unnamed protein product [Brassicogethes aeneus]|uniref:alpha-glucosidase n=1 Tax=Brassicogethes aeneus TaxID=1431903 RepID=A0A9P0BAV1_BRAAE|nr:unnamed protein product [Brassicogethes aeneus]
MHILKMNSVILLLVAIFAIGNCANSDWWKTAVFYQIYPRSFKDDSNDGVGDLKGVISKLPYLKELGITATWLSPIFKSPQVDQGYDISDYRVVDPLFGNNNDLTELIKEANKLGIKIILDFVPNHTSEEHEWFKASVNGTPKYLDYYIWRDGENKDDKKPPNNWLSNFGGIAWTYNETRKMWYYHEFAKAQPDLNYRNPDVVKDMKDILVYWLDQGVAGFRIDAVPYLFEDVNFENETATDKTKGVDPSNWNSLQHTKTLDLNETLDMIYQFRELIDEYNKNHTEDTRVIMTEAYTDFDKTLLYYGLKDGSRLGAHFTFNFDFIQSLSKNSSATDIKNIIENWFENLPEIYTYNWVVGNHDNHRIATRLGVENVDAIMLLQGILPGVMVTYNGEEIGMEDGEVDFDQRQDPQATDEKTFKEKSRDFERTPFQWDNSTNAGFNKGNKTWLPVSKNYINTNVELQNTTVDSHLNIYKSLIKNRKKISPAAKTKIEVLNSTVLTIYRTTETETYFYLYNRLGEPMIINNAGLNNSKILIKSTNSEKEVGSIINGTILVETNESLILHKDNPKDNGSFLYKTQPTVLIAVLFLIFVLNSI